MIALVDFAPTGVELRLRQLLLARVLPSEKEEDEVNREKKRFINLLNRQKNEASRHRPL